MKIGHVAMYVNDLERAKEFFIKYFGVKSNELYHNPTKNFYSYFLDFGGDTRLEIMNKGDMVDSEKFLTRTGFAHISINVGGKEKVDDLTAQLRADGFKVVSGPRTTGDGYYESCILDYEGNQIEITE